MTDLGLDGLTDDQLVALARAVAHEISMRDPAVDDAARAAMLDEAEKLRVHRQAAEAEAARLRNEERARIAQEARDQVRREAGEDPTEKRERQWAVNKRIGIMVKETLGAGYEVAVWCKEDIRRVYFDGHDDEGKPVKYVYHVTGDDHSAPGAVHGAGRDTALRQRIAAIGAYAAQNWRRHPSFSADDAVRAPAAAAPEPAAYTACKESA